MYACMCVCVCMYVCMQVCVDVCMYASMHIYIYTYIHAYYFTCFTSAIKVPATHLRAHCPSQARPPASQHLQCLHLQCLHCLQRVTALQPLPPPPHPSSPDSLVRCRRCHLSLHHPTSSSSCATTLKTIASAPPAPSPAPPASSHGAGNALRAQGVNGMFSGLKTRSWHRMCAMWQGEDELNEIIACNAEMIIAAIFSRPS